MEKRRFERFRLETPTRVEYVAPNGLKRILYLRTREISACGAYLKTLNIIPSGLKLNLEIILSVPQWYRVPKVTRDVIVRLKGEVVRQEPEGVAVCFDEAYTLRPFESG